MIVEKVPNFLTDPGENTYWFDKNGRFIYNQSREDGALTPTFTVYDILFNDYVKLNSDPTLFKIKLQFESSGYWMHDFLSTSQNDKFLMVFGSGNISATIILVQFDFQQKTYGVLDQIKIERCKSGAAVFVQDKDLFGIFYKMARREEENEEGEMFVVDENEEEPFTLFTFTTNFNITKLKSGKTTIFDHRPSHYHCTPNNPYLHNKRLWFIRFNDRIFYAARHPFRHQNSPEPPEQDECFNISHFDLNNESPKESIVGKIKDLQWFNDTNILPNLQWTQDCLFVRSKANSFVAFDLNSCEWWEKEIEFRFSILDLSRKQSEWVDFTKTQSLYTSRTAEYSQIEVDDEFICTLVNTKTNNLHRIAIRNPPKLFEITWISTLNNGYLRKTSKLDLPTKLPYKRLF